MKRVNWPILVILLFLAAVSGISSGRDDAPDVKPKAPAPPCRVIADERLAAAIKTITAEYARLSGCRITLKCLAADKVTAEAVKKEPAYDVAFCMAADGDKDGKKTPWASMASAKAIVWKFPTGEPVWVAPLTKRANAAGLATFSGGPVGHRLWAGANYRIGPGKTSTEVYDWIVRNRIKHTYPLTAARMLREIGGIRDGVCVDVGCGSGLLDIELAKRSKFKIIGLDIDANVKPIFEKRIKEAGMEKRISFVLGDAQKMPFKDNSADVVVSRGTLTFIPDIGKCLREVQRIMKPTGVAFLGGRYVYTLKKHKITTAKLKKIVAESGVPGATVIDMRGQWVKIVGPKAPAAARKFSGGPHVLALRFIADYGITAGECLLICKSDGGLERALQQGFVDNTDLRITALYPTEAHARKATERIAKANLDKRITCKVGRIGAIPCDKDTFDLIAGVGPTLIFEKDKANAMRQIHRVLQPGGAALIGGRFLHMPKHRKVSSDTLRKAAAATGISSIRVYDNMGQWVEIRKGATPPRTIP